MVVIGVVVVGGVGSYLLTSRISETKRITSTSAQPSTQSQLTSQSTTTKPVTRYTLFGKIFFDYNGNGKHEQNEPPVPSARINLDGSNLTSTNSTGHYEIRQVAEGIHQLKIFPQANFRYMCESEYEFRPVKESYEIFLIRDTRKDIGLMEGFLTMPFSRNTPEYGRRYYVNISSNSTLVDWQGGTDTYQRGDYKHSGTDFAVREGTSIVAAAPGIVFALSFNDPNGGHTVWIKHSDGYYTYYAHLKEVKVEKGQIVRRGELLGFSGSSTIGGNIVPHVHLEVRKPPYPQMGPHGLPGIDPYRSLVPSLGSQLSLWTKDNDHQFSV